MATSQEKGDTWKSDMGYLWSMLGTAIGFANLLGFGSQCYRNGGGAFLIPFITALLFLGIPMLMLEGIIGQSTKLPIVSAYGRYIGKKGKFLGWIAVLAVATIGAFYIVLTGWSLAYSFFAAAGMLTKDPAIFFSQYFLHDTGSLSDWGTLAPWVFGFTLLVSVFSWYVIAKDIRSGIERWCSAFLPILVVGILLFFGVVCFLPGAMTGFYHYLRPDFSKLLDVTIWRNVFGQLFFSLSLGLGIVVGYSRHTRQKTDIRKAMFQVAIADFLISFVAGFVIFGCIGYMSEKQGVPFAEMVNTSSIFEIGYVIFPLILQTFGDLLSRIIGCAFFFSVFIAGITGVFSIIESITGNIQVEFEMTRKRAVAISLTMVTILSIPFCMGNGTSIIGALEPLVLGNNMLFGGIAQITIFMYLAKDLKEHSVWKSGSSYGFYYYSLRYFSLIVLIICLLASLQKEFQAYEGLPDLIRLAWLAMACAIAAFLSQYSKVNHKLTQ